MQTRTLGNSTLELTEIGFGAWAIGGGEWSWGWGPQDDRDSIAAIHKALDLGISWIDTAAVYGLGHSEEVVADALAGRRSNVLIATKCSQVWDATGAIRHNLTAASVLRECEASLKRLRTDVIDLYQIHWPVDDAHIEEGWEAIGKLIEQGKVRYGGVSNFHYNMEYMRRTQAVRPMASLQSEYNLLRRYPEGETFDYCSEHNIGFLAYGPMAAGLLSGKYDPARVAPNDWRKRNPEHKEPNLALNLAFVDGLRPIAAKHNKSVAQLAIAWVLRRPEVTSAIVGARRPDQVEEIVGGAGWTLPPEDLDLIDELLVERRTQVEAHAAFVHPKE